MLAQPPWPGESPRQHPNRIHFSGLADLRLLVEDAAATISLEIADTDPVEEFDFQKDYHDGDSGYYTWCNSAYAMGVNITRALKQYGWCARIRGVESGGAAEDLPVLADCRGMEWDTG